MRKHLSLVLFALVASLGFCFTACNEPAPSEEAACSADQIKCEDGKVYACVDGAWDDGKDCNQCSEAGDACLDEQQSNDSDVPADGDNSGDAPADGDNSGDAPADGDNSGDAPADGDNSDSDSDGDNSDAPADEQADA